MRLHGSTSLKDKRRELRSLTDRMRRKFNVSVAEVGNPENYREAILGVSSVANQHSQVRAVLDKVLNWVMSHSTGEVIDSEIEIC